MNLLVLLTSFTLTAAPAAPAPADSIGVEMRGGQRFVRHRVAKGESLYALARRYNVRLDLLQAANPQATSGVQLGQIVLVPRGAVRAAAANAAAGRSTPAEAPAPTGTPGRHTVAKGETLYSIARRYNLAPTDLIRLNRLTDGTLRVGQELQLSGRGNEASGPAVAPAVASAPAAAPAPTPAPTSAPPADAPRPAALPAKTPEPAAPKAAAPVSREEPVATVTPSASPVERREERPAAPTRASEVIARVTESGMAAVIEKTGTDKYLALHKTAPVGMIMQVKNAMNGQSVYVRVIGRLPDTGENSNVLVRLSPRAVQKLGTPDARFRVETSYVP